MKSYEWGGARDGAGRPLIDKEPQKRKNIMITDKLAKKAKKIGAGNVSEGIRIALEKYKK